MSIRRRVIAWAALTAAVGCVAPDDLAQQSSAVAIPGPWVPSDRTRALAFTQHVTVVDPPAVSPLGRCTSTNAFACSCTHPACAAALPGTRELSAYLLRRYTFLRNGGLYCCRQNSATTRVPVLSVHATGRAIDLMVPTTGGDADNTLGDQVANWLVENAAYIGLQRVIWDRAFWNGERGFGLLTSASLPHTDHLHVELSVDGANRRTAFFTSGASTGTTCTPRCDGTRLIGADCASIDCAMISAPCVAGPPPACGAPAPPEPAEAARVASAVIPSVSALGGPGRFTFVGPSRLFDTRTPEASTRLVRSGGAGPVAPSSNGTFRDWSGYGLPAGATGVWLNVATVGVGAAGFATVYGAGQPRPPTSTVNYVSDMANANATTASLGAGGGVVFETINPAHVIADLYGAFAPTGAGLVPSGPTRVLDTRGDVALTAGVARAVDVSAPAGAVGVVASVAAIAGDAPGYLVAYPCGAAMPPTSVVNFPANTVVSNTLVSTLGGGQLCLWSNVSTHAVVDVTGFFVPTGGLTYTALTPQRLLDTRDPASLYSGRLGPRQVVELPVQRMPGMPSSAAAAVVNLTAVSAAGPGFVTVFPCGATVPGTSSLNFPADRAVGALAVAALGSGSLCAFSNVRTHLIVDVLGVWTGASTPSMPTVPGDDGDDMPMEGTDAGMVVTPPVDAVTPAADAVTPGADVSPPRDMSPPRDADPDDASVLVDDVAAGDAPPITGGCGCRATGTPAPRGAMTVFMALAAIARRRRRVARLLRGRPSAS